MVDGSKQSSPAGWYPDPMGQAGTQRYWDGTRWTTHVHPPADQRASPATEPPVPAPRRRTSRVATGVRWGALGAFVLVVVVVAVALTSGQQVKTVDPTSGKIEFYARSEAAPAEVADEIEGQQDAVEDEVDELRDVVREEGDPDARVADFGGTWRGANGLTYQITQFGDAAVIEELSPFGVSAYGEGTIVDDRAVFRYTAFDGSVGEADLTLVSPDRISGTFFSLTTGFGTPASMTRS